MIFESLELEKDDFILQVDFVIKWDTDELGKEFNYTVIENMWWNKAQGLDHVEVKFSEVPEDVQIALLSKMSKELSYWAEIYDADEADVKGYVEGEKRAERWLEKNVKVG